MIANERPFFTGFARGVPDGAAIDAEGCLWSCRWGGGCVVRVTPDGEVDRVVELPARNITTCAWGGEGLDVLYITTARMMTGDADRLGGSLFALKGAGRGVPDYRVGL
jgi:sugar lactone lactonase YvrE